MSVSKELERMFKRLTISEEFTFGEFLLGDADNRQWFLKSPAKPTMVKKRGIYTPIVRRPRLTFKGRTDYLQRQLYRHFISDDIDHSTLFPKENKFDYNPNHWEIRQKAVHHPISVITTPTVIDQDVLELVEELKRRRLVGEDIWAGVSDMFTDLEIAQAKGLLDDEVGES